MADFKQSDIVQMDINFTDEDYKTLRSYAESIASYDKWLTGIKRKSNCSLVVRFILELLIKGDIELPKNKENMCILNRKIRNYRPYVYKTTRDKFIDFCKEKRYSPNQAIIWVIRNKDINKYIKYF